LGPKRFCPERIGPENVERAMTMSPYAKVTLLIVASSAGPVATRWNSQIAK